MATADMMKLTGTNALSILAMNTGYQQILPKYGLF